MAAETIHLKADLRDRLGSLLDLGGSSHLQDPLGLAGGILDDDQFGSVFHTGDIQERTGTLLFLLEHHLHVLVVKTNPRR